MPLTEDQRDDIIELSVEERVARLEAEVAQLSKRQDRTESFLFGKLREVLLIWLGGCEDAAGMKRSVPPRRRKKQR